TRALESRGVAAKHELLFAHGINYASLPAWQRRGVGLRWESYEKDGYNPKTGQTVSAVRRRIALVDPLPMKEEYDAFLKGILSEATLARVRTKLDGTPARGAPPPGTKE